MLEAGLRKDGDYGGNNVVNIALAVAGVVRDIDQADSDNDDNNDDGDNGDRPECVCATSGTNDADV